MREEEVTTGKYFTTSRLRPWNTPNSSRSFRSKQSTLSSVAMRLCSFSFFVLSILKEARRFGEQIPPPYVGGYSILDQPCVLVSSSFPRDRTHFGRKPGGRLEAGFGSA